MMRRLVLAWLFWRDVAIDAVAGAMLVLLVLALLRLVLWSVSG